MEGTCSARVYPSGYVRGVRCSKRATLTRVEIEIQHSPVQTYDEAAFAFTITYDEQKVEVSRAYCATHDPVARREREEKKNRLERTEWEQKLSREDSCLAAAKALVVQLKELGIVASEHYVQDQSRGSAHYRATPTGAVVIGSAGVARILELVQAKEEGAR